MLRVISCVLLFYMLHDMIYDVYICKRTISRCCLSYAVFGLKKNNKQTKLTNIRNGRCLTYAFPPEVGRSFAEACNHAG